jgi:hypothetical protein
MLHDLCEVARRWILDADRLRLSSLKYFFNRKDGGVGFSWMGGILSSWIFRLVTPQLSWLPDGVLAGEGIDTKGSRSRQPMVACHEVESP